MSGLHLCKCEAIVINQRKKKNHKLTKYKTNQPVQRVSVKKRNFPKFL